MSPSGAASKWRSRPGLTGRVARLALLCAGICGAAGSVGGVVAGLTGCAHPHPTLGSAPAKTTPAAGARASSAQASGAQASAAQAWIETQLFFGLGPAASPQQGISEARWRQFLDAEVTPRFPSGLTVVDAYGQWQGASEASVERLRSKMVVILHPDSAKDNDNIEAVRAAWKKLTGDVSVLRVSRPAQVSF